MPLLVLLAALLAGLGSALQPLVATEIALHEGHPDDGKCSDDPTHDSLNLIRDKFSAADRAGPGPGDVILSWKCIEIKDDDTCVELGGISAAKTQELYRTEPMARQRLGGSFAVQCELYFFDGEHCDRGDKGKAGIGFPHGGAREKRTAFSVPGDAGSMRLYCETFNGNSVPGGGGSTDGKKASQSIARQILNFVMAHLLSLKHMAFGQK